MNPQETPKRLVSFSTMQFPEDALRLEDIAGKDVTIISGKVQSGKFGEYALLDVEVSDGKTETIVTSGMLVVEALKNVITADAFPLVAKFSRTGRAWRIE